MTEGGREGGREEWLIYNSEAACTKGKDMEQAPVGQKSNRWHGKKKKVSNLATRMTILP